MTRTPWYESDNPDRWGAHAIKWWALAALAAVLIGALVWGVNVATSKPRGQGDAYARKNSADNWTTEQARFNAMHQDILATDRKLDIAAAQAKARPTDLTATQTYTGLVSYCQSVVADYNTRSRSYLAQDFRDADLPAQIDTLDPLTDCKEPTR